MCFLKYFISKGLCRGTVWLMSQDQVARRCLARCRIAAAPRAKRAARLLPHYISNVKLGRNVRQGSGVELRSLLIYLLVGWSLKSGELDFGPSTQLKWDHFQTSVDCGGFTQLAFSILATLFCSDAFLLSIR